MVTAMQLPNVSQYKCVLGELCVVISPAAFPPVKGHNSILCWEGGGV